MNQPDDHFLTEELSRYSNLAHNHLRDIRELQRITDDEIRRVSERISQIRARSESNPHSHLNLDEEDLNACIFSTKLIIVSPLIIVALIFLLYTELKVIVLNENVQFDINEDFYLLESEVMYVPYAISYAIINIIYWTLNLLIVKILTKFEKIRFPKKQDKFHLCDLIYFNPFFFNMVIFFYNKSYITTIFDLFCIMTTSSMFTISFVLFNYGVEYFKHKISSITNIYDEDNRSLVIRMRLFSAFMVMSVILKGYVMSFLTSESDFMFVFLIQFKTIYTACKYFSSYYENEVNLKQLYNPFDEEEYLHTQKFKFFVNFLNMTMMILMLSVTLVFFYKEGGFFLFVPVGLILLRSVYSLYEQYKQYKEVTIFFSNLEKM